MKFGVYGLFDCGIGNILFASFTLFGEMDLVAQCAIITISIVAQVFTTLLVVFAPMVFDVLGLFFFMKMFFTFVLAFVWYFESHDRFLLSCVLLELLQKKLQHLFSLALFLLRSPVSDQLLMTCNKPNNEAMKGFRGATRNLACRALHRPKILTRLFSLCKEDEWQRSW